jgi:hypothetical protein
MIGIFAYGLESPRQLSIACAVIVAAYGPFCILVHLAVSYSSQTELFIHHFNTHQSTSLHWTPMLFYILTLKRLSIIPVADAIREEGEIRAMRGIVYSSNFSHSIETRRVQNSP